MPHALAKRGASSAEKAPEKRGVEVHFRAAHANGLQTGSVVWDGFAPLQASEVPRPLKRSCGVEFGWYRGAYQWLRPFRVSERDGAFFFALPRKVRKEQH